MNRKTIFLTAAAFLVLALVNLVSYHQMNAFSRLDRDIDQSQVFLAKLEHFRVSLGEAQSAQRGYLLTGSETYARMYRTALSGVDKYSKALWAVGAGSKSRRQALSQVIALTRQHVILLEEGIKNRRGRGIANMDQINGLVDSLEERERLALDDCISRSEDNFRRADLFTIAGDAIALVFIVIVVMALRRQLEVSARAQVAASRAAKEWEATFDSVSDMVSIQSPDLTLIRVNKAFARAFKTSPASLAGKKCWEIVHGAAGPIENCPHLKVLETGKPSSYELYEPKVGLYLEVSVSPIFGELGKVASTVHIARDISARKNYEEQITRLSTAVEQSVNAVVMTDTKGGITYVNGAFEKITGYTKEEAIGQNVRLLESGEQSPQFYQQLWATITGGQAWRGRFHNKKKDGSLYWEDALIAPIKDDAGKIWAYIAIKEDVTARKDTEEALQKVREDYSTLAENLNIGVYRNSADEEGGFLQANSALVKMLGFSSKEELYKIKVKDLYRDPLERRRFLSDMAAKGSVRNRELRLRTKDGVSLIVSCSAAAHYGADSRMEWIDGVLEDITERKRIEDSLGQLRRRMEVILESAGEGIAGMDINGKITFANPAASRMLGWQGDELIGMDGTAVLYGHNGPPDGQSVPADCFVGVCRSGQPYHRDNEEFSRKDGARFPVEYTCSPKKDAGQVIGAVIVFRDISERKEVERLKDEFISMVSHELRTPLTTIRESVSQVVDGILGPTTAQQQEFLAICLNDADRLKRIIDDLLDMSKIEAGKLTLAVSLFDAVGLVKEIAATFQPLVTNKGLELRTMLPGQPLQIRADRDRLMQVFTNIAGNAVKFTDQGAITIGVKESGGNLECWVEDTGQGIAEKDLPRLFEKFRQFDASINSSQKGTGLGMAISKGIVELHQGQIKVESRPGQGTKVTFFIPVSI